MVSLIRHALKVMMTGNRFVSLLLILSAAFLRDRIL